MSKQTVIHQDFDSLEAAREFASVSRNPANRHMWRDTTSGAHGSAISWLGIAGGVQAVSAAVSRGWPEGVERMEEALSGFDAPPMPTSVRRRMSRADMGDSVDMGHIWRGELATAWSRCAPRDSRAVRRVTIACPIWDNCHVDAARLFWRGAAALTLADLLTAAGYAVQIAATCYSGRAYTSGEDYSARVIVKDFASPIDKQAIASSICLSGFFRTIMFACCENADAETTGGLGYGKPAPVREGEIADIADCMSAETAREWIVAKLLQITEGETA